MRRHSAAQPPCAGAARSPVHEPVLAQSMAVAASLHPKLQRLQSPLHTQQPNCSQPEWRARVCQKQQAQALHISVKAVEKTRCQKFSNLSSTMLGQQCPAQACVHQLGSVCNTGDHTSVGPSWVDRQGRQQTTSKQADCAGMPVAP